MNPTAFHSSTSWPGSSEPHVIPTQDQPTSSEPEIDLEALMELSTEEQKTQLEVEWVTGPQTQGWGMEAGLGPRGTQEPCFPIQCGENQFRGENSWETGDS